MRWHKDRNRPDFLEYDPSYNADQNSVRLLLESQVENLVKSIEEVLQTRMPAVVLSCDTEQQDLIEADIVGLVRTPKDEPLTERK